MNVYCSVIHNPQILEIQMSISTWMINWSISIWWNITQNFKGKNYWYTQHLSESQVHFGQRSPKDYKPYGILRKAKVKGWRADQWLPGIGGEMLISRREHRGIIWADVTPLYLDGPGGTVLLPHFPVKRRQKKMHTLFQSRELKVKNLNLCFLAELK